ncbi:MAG: hypothetical protein HQL56_07430 [Magnetococcales bacterium]|nr:hypothetical protein [Magnetococcales bacterium]
MRKNAPGLLPLLVVLGTTMAGCTALFPPPPPPPPPIQPAQQAPNPVMHEVDLIHMSHSVADALVAELRKNHPAFSRRKPILVTTFVPLSDLETSSELGMMIADQLSTRMTQQGFAVVEAKLRQELAIRPKQGEFILSRDVEKLAEAYKAFAVVVGNYTRARGLLYLTSRIIQVDNRQILASISAKVPIGATARDLLIETGEGSSLSVVDH